MHELLATSWVAKGSAYFLLQQFSPADVLGHLLLCPHPEWRSARERQSSSLSSGCSVPKIMHVQRAQVSHPLHASPHISRTLDCQLGHRRWPHRRSWVMW